MVDASRFTNTLNLLASFSVFSKYSKSKSKNIPFLDALTFSHAHNKRGFCYIRGSNCILLHPRAS